MISNEALDQLFRTARSYNSWLEKPVDSQLLKTIYDLAKMGPTSVNCSPMRVIFIQSNAAKERLKPCLAAGNLDKTMTAPVISLIAADYEFYTKLPQLFPHTNAKEWFEGKEELIHTTAFRNTVLQGAYLILAARACGLDCGPISGFDHHRVDETFFKGTSFKCNFICNLGYGDPTGLFPRSPRFEFEEVCQIL